jgi:DNA-binding transcriptional MerR regulator
MSIAQLADAAGVSRRAVRFYVQQQLLPPPLGRGRGRHYDRSHLERLRRIGELQSVGHSLDAIRRLLRGEAVEAPAPLAPRRRALARPLVSAQLWTRVPLADGVELHFDARRFSPSAEALAKIRQFARDLFDISPDVTGPEEGSDEIEDEHDHDEPPTNNHRA